LAKLATEVDPNYAWPWVMIAYTLLSEVRFKIGDVYASLAEAEHALAQVGRLAPELPERFAVLSFMHAVKGELDKATEVWRQGEALAPHHAENLATFSLVALFREDWQEVRRLTETAMRLHPYYPVWYLSHASFAYKHLGMEEEAIAAFEERARRVAKLRGKVSRFQLGDLAACYATFGRWNEAKQVVERLLTEYPDHNVKAAESVLRGWYPKESTFTEQRKLLVKVGIPENPAPPLPDKPSIAVLAFNNMSDDPKQDYFAEGIAEDIITDLSKLDGLFVIARNSSFSYRGKSLPIKGIARELGVKYVLEGSVRRAGDVLRVNTQLIDAETDAHVWAERYDGELSRIFEFQDKITRGVVQNIAGELVGDEALHSSVRMTSNIEAYDAYLQARRHYGEFRGRGTEAWKVQDLLRTAVRSDPEFAEAYGLLALNILQYVRYWGDWGSTTNLVSYLPKDGIVDASIAELALYDAPTMVNRTIKELISKSLGLRDNVVGHSAQALYSAFRQGDLDRAAAEFEQLLSISPGDADARIGYASILRLQGRTEQARRLIKEAIRLNPSFPSAYQRELGKVEFVQGNYEATEEMIGQVLEVDSLDYASRWYLVAAIALRGNVTEATRILQATPQRAMGQNHPSMVRRREPYRDTRTTEKLLEGLRLAGLSSGFEKKSE
jgi:TolB-like protein/cytochrome c-type biogenesis protein CcmH/NrfG